MANPSTRQGLIDYCLRQLGHPVLEINVDEDQIEDRVDEALQYFREFHFDSVEFFYLKQAITASTLRLNTLVAGNFTYNEKVVGQTSGAIAFVVSNTGANILNVQHIEGTFVDGETIIGSVSGVGASLAAEDAVTLGNIDNRYFDISPDINGIIRVLPLSERSSSVNLFDVRYQLMLNNIQSLTATDLVYYTQLKTHLNLINDLMAGQKPIRYTKHMNRLYVDMDWKNDVRVGDYLIVECYRELDPNTFTDVYNDLWLKEYTTALIKRQWGNNLKKFEGVQMPGGVTLNGQKIFDEAVEEIKELKEKVESTYQLPPDMFVG